MSYVYGGKSDDVFDDDNNNGNKDGTRKYQPAKGKVRTIPPLDNHKDDKINQKKDDKKGGQGGGGGESSKKRDSAAK